MKRICIIDISVARASAVLLRDARLVEIPVFAANSGRRRAGDLESGFVDLRARRRGHCHRGSAYH